MQVIETFGLILYWKNSHCWKFAFGRGGGGGGGREWILQLIYGERFLESSMPPTSSESHLATHPPQGLE